MKNTYNYCYLQQVLVELLG